MGQLYIWIFFEATRYCSLELMVPLSFTLQPSLRCSNKILQLKLIFKVRSTV